MTNGVIPRVGNEERYTQVGNEERYTQGVEQRCYSQGGNEERCVPRVVTRRGVYPGCVLSGVIPRW